MSTRIRFTPRPKLACWLQAKAEQYGLPLATTAEQLLSNVQRAEEGRAADGRPPAQPGTSNTVAGALQTHDGRPDIRDEVAQAIAGVSWLELTSADRKH